jgi:hypothetical protein
MVNLCSQSVTTFEAWRLRIGIIYDSEEMTLVPVLATLPNAHITQESSIAKYSANFKSAWCKSDMTSDSRGRWFQRVDRYKSRFHLRSSGNGQKTFKDISAAYSH